MKEVIRNKVFSVTCNISSFLSTIIVITAPDIAQEASQESSKKALKFSD